MDAGKGPAGRTAETLFPLRRSTLPPAGVLRHFDGRMALYRGHNCPPDDLDLAECNDDACELGGGAIISIGVSCGELLTLRVGGFNGAFGKGTFDLTLTAAPPCPPPMPCSPPPCPWDCQAVPDGSVNVPDLLALLSQWGGCVDCSCDLDHTDMVAVPDLLMLLSVWGLTCP